MRVYGPVPSRRFGLSLGIDIVPHKTCTFDCIYCQLGETDCLISEPDNFFDIDEIINDVEEALLEEATPDVITLAGSGDPTLYRSIKELILRLKEISDVPVLLITNGALLWKKEVAEAALLCDILAPSLDAGDPETFAKVNRPHPDVTFDKLLKGLKDVTCAHTGCVRLEIMLIKGVNDDEESMTAISKLAKEFRFDRIDLNTPVRPPVPERNALPCDEEVLDRAKKIFGSKAYPIGKFTKRMGNAHPKKRSFTDRDKDIRETLLRRPCTVEDLSTSLSMEKESVEEILKKLIDAGLVSKWQVEDRTYFRVLGSNPTVRPKAMN